MPSTCIIKICYITYHFASDKLCHVTYVCGTVLFANSLTITGGGTEGNNEQTSTNNESLSSSSSSSLTSSHQQHKEKEHEFLQLLSSKDTTRTDRQGQPQENIGSLSYRLRSVSQAYHHQHNTLTRSYHHNTNSMDTNSIVEESMKNSLPYHTIIIDCAPITFVDQMGAKALYQVCIVCVISVGRVCVW